MAQNWERLLFLHWAVPAEMLAPLIPPGLTLDTYEGRAYVGLVPFTMTGIRPVWAPAVPWLSHFHETNVRTYVHRDGKDPGVWFFSLDAANPVAVKVARTWWRLPYHFARMRMERSSGEHAEVAYETERLWPGPVPATASVRYTPTGTPSASTPGTREHFLAERYLLYAENRGRLYSGRVYHTPYPLQTASVRRLDETLLAAARIVRPDEEPLAHYASGVKVRIFPLRRV